MRATLTIAGLFNYRPDIFDELLLPAGVERETMIFQILEECAALETRFPDADYMKLSIKHWSIAMQEAWKRRLAAMLEKYDPLHNYDRTEEVAEGITSDGTSTGARTAFNEDSFKNTDRVSETGSSDRKLTSRTFGNIGVTTSQQMLIAELDLTDKLNFYRSIVEDFKAQYCVAVYS